MAGELNLYGKFFYSSAWVKLSSLGADSDPSELSPSPIYINFLFADNSSIKTSLIENYESSVKIDYLKILGANLNSSFNSGGT